MITKFVKSLLEKLDFRFEKIPFEVDVVRRCDTNSGITFFGVLDLGFSLTIRYLVHIDREIPSQRTPLLLVLAILIVS